ncbi:MAG: AsmA family protein [Hyphomicrobiaceae bacterium]|nr:AsmA family protein [Hyphomicrobiaceae bacterium]
MQNIRPGRLAMAGALLVSCIALGLSAPLVFNFDASEFKLANVAVFAASRDGHEITTPFSIATAPRIRLERGSIALSDSAAARDAGERADALPRDRSAKLVIDGGVFQIAGGHQGDETGPSGPAAHLVKALQTLNFHELAVRRSTVRVVLPDGHIETLTDVVGEVLVNRQSSIAIRGSGKLRGQSITFDLSAPAVADSKAGPRVPLKLRLKSELLDVAFDGRLGASDVVQLQGRMELAISNVRQAARWVGAPWPPGSGLRDARIKGEFEWQGPALAFDKATFRMDGNEATGALALSFAGERPALTGTLAMPTLDLTPYVPDKTAGPLPAFLTWGSSEGESLAAPIGRRLDADIRVSAARVRIGDAAFDRFAASLSLKGGRLLADIAEIGIEGGRGSGQLTVELAGEQTRIAMRGRLEDIDASRASALLLGHGAVHGLSTITVDLAATGDSPADLLNALRGKASFSLREGGKLGIDVRSLLGAAQRGDVEGWGLATRGQTSVDGLEAKLRVDKGVVASELVEATAGDSLLKATGTVSLLSRQLNLRLLLDAVPKAARADLPRDVIVFRGPWAAPSITLER